MPRRIVTEKRLPVRSDPLNAIDPRQLSLPIGPRTDAERASAIVESLQRLSGTEDVFASFEELDALPTNVVLDALTTWTGPAPDPSTLDDATRAAHGFPPPPLRLRTISRVNDADIFDIGEVAEAQLRIAGKLYDGQDLAAEERLDGEVEGSFAGTLERRELAIDEDGRKDTPLFDVLRYADDSGTIFRAGTTDVVGAIADGRIEMRDRRERIAVEAALAATAEAEERARPEVIEALDEVEAVEAEDVEPEPETEPAPTRRMRELAETPRAPKKAAAAKKKSAAAKKTAIEATPKKQSAIEAAPKKQSAIEAAPKKQSATKKTAAATPTSTKTSSTKAATKKTAAATPTSTKTSSTKAATKKAAAAEPKAEKKTAAKASSKKTAAKKTAAKKSKKASAKD